MTIASVEAVEDGDRIQDVRRRQILDAAEGCFARSGFHGASMQDICAEAGMSPGALYRYFKSKEALIEAICLDERARTHGILEVLEGDGDFTETFVQMGLEYFQSMNRPGATALMLEVFAEGLRNTAVGDRFLCNEEMVRDAMSRFVARAAARGDIRDDIDQQAAIGFLMAMGEGIVMRMPIDPSLTPERVKPLLAACIDAIFGRDSPKGSDEHP